MSREGMRLRYWAQADRDEFDHGITSHDPEDYGWSYREQGCTCFTGCAPCSFCTHPGNPMNQDEDDTCWEPDV